MLAFSSFPWPRSAGTRPDPGGLGSKLVSLWFSGGLHRPAWVWCLWRDAVAVDETARGYAVGSCASVLSAAIWFCIACQFLADAANSFSSVPIAARPFTVRLHAAVLRGPSGSILLLRPGDLLASHPQRPGSESRVCRGPVGRWLGVCG